MTRTFTKHLALTPGCFKSISHETTLTRKAKKKLLFGRKAAALEARISHTGSFHHLRQTSPESLLNQKLASVHLYPCQISRNVHSIAKPLHICCPGRWGWDVSSIKSGFDLRFWFRGQPTFLKATFRGRTFLKIPTHPIAKKYRNSNKILFILANFACLPLQMHFYKACAFHTKTCTYRCLNRHESSGRRGRWRTRGLSLVVQASFLLWTHKPTARPVLRFPLQLSPALRGGRFLQDTLLPCCFIMRHRIFVFRPEWIAREHSELVRFIEQKFRKKLL